MWLTFLLCSSATGLALGLARLKVLVLISATIAFSLTAAIGGIVFGLRWDRMALTVIASGTILQSSYFIAGYFSEFPRPRTTLRTSLRPDLVRMAQSAIGEELRAYFQVPHKLPRLLQTKVNQLAARYG